MKIKVLKNKRLHRVLAEGYVVIIGVHFYYLGDRLSKLSPHFTMNVYDSDTGATSERELERNTYTHSFDVTSKEDFLNWKNNTKRYKGIVPGYTLLVCPDKTVRAGCQKLSVKQTRELYTVLKKMYGE